MIRAAALALIAAAAATAAADPAVPRFELPDQPPPLGPASMIVQLDTGLVTGHPTLEARNATVTVGLRVRARRWMLGIEAGAQAWSDRLVDVGVHQTRGLQPTNLIVEATRWHRLASAHAVELGFHVAGMAGLAHGIPDPVPDYVPDDNAGDIKAPSQLIRIDAMPYDRPSEQSIAIGGVGRLDTARWFAQAELAYNATFIKGDYAPDSTVPSRWMLLAGAGYRPARSLAVVVTLLGQRRVNNHYPASALVLGAGLDLAVPRGAVSLRAEQRVEDCHLGTWVPSRDHTARCSRVAVDYTLRF